MCEALDVVRVVRNWESLVADGNRPALRAREISTTAGSGITGGLSAPAGGGNRPTIGLPEIGSVRRVHDAVRAATWRTGKLEFWVLRGRGAFSIEPHRHQSASSSAQSQLQPLDAALLLEFLHDSHESLLVVQWNE